MSSTTRSTKSAPTQTAAQRMVQDATGHLVRSNLSALDTVLTDAGLSKRDAVRIRQSALRQVFGYVPRSVNVPVQLTGIARYDASGVAQYGRPAAGTVARGSKSATPKRSASKRPASSKRSPASRNRTSKRDAQTAPTPKVLAGLTSKTADKV